MDYFLIFIFGCQIRTQSAILLLYLISVQLCDRRIIPRPLRTLKPFQFCSVSQLIRFQALVPAWLLPGGTAFLFILSTFTCCIKWTNCGKIMHSVAKVPVLKMCYVLSKLLFLAGSPPAQLQQRLFNSQHNCSAKLPLKTIQSNPMETTASYVGEPNYRAPDSSVRMSRKANNSQIKWPQHNKYRPCPVRRHKPIQFNYALNAMFTRLLWTFSFE